MCWSPKLVLGFIFQSRSVMTVQAVAQDGRFRHRIGLSETPYFAHAQ